MDIKIYLHTFTAVETGERNIVDTRRNFQSISETLIS